MQASTPENDERFETFETKLAFQEDTIQQLNDALVEQQSRIDHLEISLRSLLERFDDEPDLPDISVADERPPHY
ncbi:MAG: SlyX family protein [Gammaproteobacteria bacterium]|nr:SlyX family protein [Gammaproteobacteria bacterium]